MSDLDELYDRIGRMSKRIEKLEQRLDGMTDRIERLEEWQKTFAEDSDTFGKVLADFDERLTALEQPPAPAEPQGHKPCPFKHSPEQIAQAMGGLEPGIISEPEVVDHPGDAPYVYVTCPICAADGPWVELYPNDSDYDDYDKAREAAEIKAWAAWDRRA